MSDAPSGTPAGWYPDPHGRHQQRYWDGTNWTEHVSDQGVSGTDPLGSQSPPQAAPWGAPPGGATGTGSGSARPSWLIPAILAAVVLIGAGVAAFLLLGSDDDEPRATTEGPATTEEATAEGTDGEGTTTTTVPPEGGTTTESGSLDSDDSVGIHQVSVPEGAELTVEVRPEDDLDVVVGIGASEDVVDELEDADDGPEVDSGADSSFETHADLPEDVTLFDYLDASFGDETFEGDIPVAGEYTVLVAGFLSGTGEYEIEITVEP